LYSDPLDISATHVKLKKAVQMVHDLQEVENNLLTEHNDFVNSFKTQVRQLQTSMSDGSMVIESVTVVTNTFKAQPEFIQQY
jgi:hypothetical protein